MGSKVDAFRHGLIRDQMLIPEPAPVVQVKASPDRSRLTKVLSLLCAVLVVAVLGLAVFWLPWDRQRTMILTGVFVALLIIVRVFVIQKREIQHRLEVQLREIDRSLEDRRHMMDDYLERIENLTRAMTSEVDRASMPVDEVGSSAEEIALLEVDDRD